MKDDLAVIARYGSRTEAELFANILMEAGIPTVLRGSDVGIFGPGFSGQTAMGVQLLVSPRDVDRAHEILATENDDSDAE